MTINWNAISAGAAVVAAVIAAWQIRLSRIDANRRATLTALEKVEARMQPTWRLNLGEVRATILKCYADRNVPLPDEAAAYLSFLDSMDLLAFAANNNLVVPRLALKYTRTLRKAPMLSEEFLRELQTSCNDPEVYSDLLIFLKEKDNASWRRWIPKRNH